MTGLAELLTYAKQLGISAQQTVRPANYKPLKLEANARGQAHLEPVAAGDIIDLVSRVNHV